jgi:hypothetical protein
MFRMVRGWLLVPMFLIAAGGLLTSTQYALVFRVSVWAAVVVFVVALVCVLARAAVLRVRPRGFGTVIWSGFAGGLVTTGLLTLSGSARVLVLAWAVVAVITFLGERSMHPAGNAMQ